MADQALRDAQRGATSLEGEAVYLRRRVRAGELTQLQVELAAFFGHPAACLLAGGRVLRREDGVDLGCLCADNRHWTACGHHKHPDFAVVTSDFLERFGRRAAVAFAAVAVQQTLIQWLYGGPYSRGDVAPYQQRAYDATQALVDAALDWAECPCEDHLAAARRWPYQTAVGPGPYNMNHDDRYDAPEWAAALANMLFVADSGVAGLAAFAAVLIGGAVEFPATTMVASSASWPVWNHARDIRAAERRAALRDLVYPAMAELVLQRRLG